MADAADLALAQQKGKWGAVNTIQDFAKNIRMRRLVTDFMREDVSSPQQFNAFAARNSMSGPEAASLLQLVKAQKDAYPAPPQQKFASSPLGIYNVGTGDITHPAPDKFTPTDYYRVNDDGSVESRKANTPAESAMWEKQGFKRGSYRKLPLGSSTNEPNTIKTWIKEDGSLWHAPSNVKPPKGARPFSEAGELEKRLLIGQELTSIRNDKRQVRRELDRIMSLPDNIDFYKPQKDRIPSLKQELDDLNQREEELLEGGNSMSQKMPSEVESIAGYNASKHPGKKLTNSDTGQTYVSDGKVWKKQGE
jgi:hypothetical protein